MQQIKDLFNNVRIAPTKSRRTERGDLITEFAERLNAERSAPYKPLSISYVAYLLSHIKVSELYLLLKKCNEAKSFTALFWYYVKPKK
jgi:hypothetical protein